jgi:transposase
LSEGGRSRVIATSARSIDFARRRRDRGGKEVRVAQVTARLPEELVAALDAAASQLRRSRADVVRQAIEDYLDDFEDISAAIAALHDPGDPDHDWANVRRDLLDRG